MSRDLFLDGPLKGRWLEIQDHEYAVTAAVPPQPRRASELDDELYPVSVMETVTYQPHRLVIQEDWDELASTCQLVVINSEHEVPWGTREMRVWSLVTPRVWIWAREAWESIR